MRRHPEMFGLTHYAPDNDVSSETGGGGATAVLDRTDTGAENAGGGADTEVDADTGEGAEGADGGKKPLENAEDKPKLDADTQALIDAALAEKEQELESKRQAAAAKAAEDKTAQERIEAIKKLRTTRDEKVMEIGIPGKDEDGNDVIYTLPKAIKDQLVKVLADHDTDIEEHFGIEFRERQEANMLAAVPEDKRASLQEALDGAGDYKAHAEAFGEAYAPHAKVIKTMGLDELVELSPKAKREHLTALKAAKDEGRKLGQDDPDAEPKLDPGNPVDNEKKLTVQTASKTPVAELVRRRQQQRR